MNLATSLGPFGDEPSVPTRSAPAATKPLSLVESDQVPRTDGSGHRAHRKLFGDLLGDALNELVDVCRVRHA